MFGKVQEIPQRETTPFYPRSPYGAAKVYAYWITVNYREAYGLFRLQRHSVQPRISAARRDLRLAQDHPRADAHPASACRRRLHLGNLDSRRDWGHARDYVRAQWLMLQQEEPDDFVIATGKQYSVRDFVVAAASLLDMKIEWRGRGRRRSRHRCRDAVARSCGSIRAISGPTEVETLLGDATKAREKLGWRAGDRLRGAGGGDGRGGSGTGASATR